MSSTAPSTPARRQGAILATLILMLGLMGCGSSAARLPPAAAAAKPQREEEPPWPAPALTQRIIDAALDQLLDDDPAWGRALGLHQYDGKVPAFSADAIGQRIERLRSARQRLQGQHVPPDAQDLALDLKLVCSMVDGVLFQLVDWDAWHKNPLFYSGIFGVNDYLDRNYASLEERARQLLAHEEAALLEVGQVLPNLVSPLPRPFVETAIKVFDGYAEYLKRDVVALLRDVGDPEFQRRLTDTNAALAGEAEAIARHLTEIELPQSDMGYALGRERYAAFVQIQEGLSLPIDEFAKMAEADLAANKQAFEKLSQTVLAKRPRARELLPQAAEMTEASRRFVEEWSIATVPAGPPPLVRETPPFMRWNQAFLVAPGPFERPDLESYYYITLPDRSWRPSKQREYLMTLGTLVSTTVHETYPGHYLHGLWMTRAPTRVQKAVTSYSFSEGWAHYSEQMMIDAGFAAEIPEARLGQLSDALLRDCRFVVSIGLHTQGMTLAAAERRFIDDCHQDAASAHEQAVRGSFDPGYFAYTLGKLQILALREEASAKLGPRFSLQRFHDALLSHGSAPVPLIRDRVLAQLESLGAAL
jgi:hypothetical protein